MTIKEVEDQYAMIVASTGKLLNTVTKDVSSLSDETDKKVGTENDTISIVSKKKDSIDTTKNSEEPTVKYEKILTASKPLF